MARLSRADEIVVCDFQPFPKLLKTDNGLVALLLRGETVFIGSLLDLLPMLIRARQEKGGCSEQAVIAGKHIRQNRCIRVADVRLIDVKENDVDADAVKFPDTMPRSLKDSILRDMKRSCLFIHQTDLDSPELFDLEMESEGTQRLFHLAPLVIDALETGGVLLVDELDHSMHPFMAELIIRLFNDRSI